MNNYFIDDFHPGYAPPTKGGKRQDTKKKARVNHLQWETVNKGVKTREFIAVPRHLPPKLKEAMKAIKTGRPYQGNEE